MDRQPNNQLQLAFDLSPTGETREQTSEGTESAVTEHSTESPTDAEHNLKCAWQRVEPAEPPCTDPYARWCDRDSL